MVRSYEELNALEKQGFRQILMENGWCWSKLSNIKEETMCDALTKKIGGRYVSVKINDFRIDEE